MPANQILRRSRLPGLLLASGLLLSGCLAVPDPEKAQSVEFLVTRMTCTDCDVAITAELLALEGVFSASADFTRGFAAASYDPAFVQPEEMIRAIERLGYGAEVQQPGGGDVSPVEVAPPEDDGGDEPEEEAGGNTPLAEGKVQDPGPKSKIKPPRY